MQDEYRTVKDIANKLKVTRQAVSAWIKSGQLKAYKIGKYWRIKESDLESFIERNCNYYTQN